MFKGSAWVTLQLKDDQHRILIEEGDTIYIPAKTNYSVETALNTEAQFYMFMNSNYPTISLASDIKNDNSSLENLM